MATSAEVREYVLYTTGILDTNSILSRKLLVYYMYIQ